jgi:hypothetical protein
MNLDEIYDYVSDECKGLSMVSEVGIIDLVGKRGLRMLKEHNLLEDRGIIHGRQMYVLLKK